MATAPTYCTHRQLKDVFPQLDSFDNKRPIYGWTSLGNNVYVAYNTGLVTQLFVDGQETNAAQANTGGATWAFTTNGALSASQLASSTAYNNIIYDDPSVGSESDLKAGQYARVGSSNYEYVYIQSIDASSNTMTVLRGALGSSGNIAAWADETTVIEWIEVNSANNWYYDSYLDHTLLYSTTNPNDSNVEAGEDFSTLITRMTANASRYLDAKLDPNLPKEQLKDKEGNYDYIIVRTTALLAAVFLIRSHDPTSEVATAMMEDAMGNIDALNKGGAALSWQTTGDSSKGVIRDVTYTSGSIRPVDTRGRWSGSWDLIKIKVIGGGVLGTATYSVWVKDGESLKNRQVVTAEKITGDYQHIANGIEIRFGGSSDSSVATANDEWEMEVAGWREEVDNSSINSVKMTRGGTRTVRFGKY
tara:strand:- start:2 stop:1255 length:1254 start_codon:yes stop_codon:yes gene_type:complete